MRQTSVVHDILLTLSFTKRAQAIIHGEGFPLGPCLLLRLGRVRTTNPRRGEARQGIDVPWHAKRR